MANEIQNVEKKQEYIIDIISDDNGKVQIANGVVASIVQKYVLGIEGVMRMAPQGIIDGITSIFSRRGYDKSIIIENSDNGLILSLALNLKFGSIIPEVTSKIQKTLMETIPMMTGYKVSKVNVLVTAFEEEIPEEPKEEEEKKEDEVSAN